jgi:long-subunit fatty acid transport protein
MRNAIDENGLPRAAARALGAALLALALIALLPSPAEATNGAAPIAQSPKAAGRGGTEVAIGDSALSQAVNPATAIEIPYLRIDGMFGWLITRTRFQNDLNNDLDTSYDTVLGGGAIAWDPFSSGELDDPGSDWRIGFSVFAPVGGGGASKIETPVFPEGQTESSNFFFLNIMPSVAYRAHPKFTVGFGVNMIYFNVETEGLVGTNDNSGGRVFRYWNPDNTPIEPPQAFEVQGQQVTWGEVFNLAGTEDANESSRVDLTDGTGFGIGATIGFLWEPHEQVTVGLSYRTPGFVPTAEGDAEIDADRSIESLNSDPQLATLLGGVIETYLPNRGQQGFKSNYDFEIDDFDQPAVLQAGVAVRPLETWLLALDVRYIFWSDAFGEKDVLLKGGTNDDINEINGSNKIRDKKLLRWDDQLVIGVGTAFMVPELTENMVFRLGYNYGNNPQPAETFTANSGIVEHHLTLGASYYHDAWDFDFAYVYAFPNEIEVADGKSDAGNAYNDSATRAEQHFVYLGVGYQF